MYNSLKKILNTVLPTRFITKNEAFFRFFHGIFYFGTSHQCTVCEHKLRSFIKLKNEDLLCPFCGSLSRNRRLWQLLHSKYTLQGNVLHFSPSRNIYRKLKKRSDITYTTSDFENEFIADHQFDITNIAQIEASFDRILCFHVLEHIPDDEKAMRELYRVTKPNGLVFIQTPFKDGEIYENEAITTPEARLQHFGQEDHVRIYSPKGLQQRLEHAGFSVNAVEFPVSKNDTYYGFKSPEIVLVATK